MQFSEIAQDEWEDLKPYLDTCLLPVTGLNGKESPYEATEQLERLRDLLDSIERPYHGRTVTYPAYHFTCNMAKAEDEILHIAANLKSSGFRYVIVVTLLEMMKDRLAGTDRSSIDLIITPSEVQQIDEHILSIWHS